MLGPGVGNINGVFEDRDFQELHSGAIDLYDPKSRGWKLVTNNFLQFSENYLSLAKRLVNERNIKYSTWGWKDPRTILFMEQWKQIIPNLKVLLIHRSCHEVVYSLIERSKKVPQGSIGKIGILESTKLWNSYFKLTCRYKEKYPNDTLLLPLKSIINNDTRIIEMIQDRLRINLDYQSIQNIFDRNLLHRKVVSLRHFISIVSSFIHNSVITKFHLDRLSDS